MIICCVTVTLSHSTALVNSIICKSFIDEAVFSEMLSCKRFYKSVFVLFRNMYHI